MREGVEARVAREWRLAFALARVRATRVNETQQPALAPSPRRAQKREMVSTRTTGVFIAVIAVACVTPDAMLLRYLESTGGKVKLADRNTWIAGTMKKTKLALDTMTGAPI